MVFRIYKILLKSFGPQGWWPIRGIYDIKKKSFSKAEKFEIAIGAVLTQNTSWKNAASALYNLHSAKMFSCDNILNCDINQLKHLIRSSGYYNQKSVRLKNISEFIKSKKSDYNAFSREDLLRVSGIGRETADSILLYACQKPFFIVDAYTKRFIHRTGLSRAADYDKVQNFFMKNLSKDIEVYKEYHALIVELSKRHCRKTPVCKGCPLADLCVSSIKGKKADGKYLRITADEKRN